MGPRRGASHVLHEVTMACNEGRGRTWLALGLAPSLKNQVLNARVVCTWLIAATADAGPARSRECVGWALRSIIGKRRANETNMDDPREIARFNCIGEAGISPALSPKRGSGSGGPAGSEQEGRVS